MRVNANEVLAQQVQQAPQNVPVNQLQPVQQPQQVQQQPQPQQQTQEQIPAPSTNNLQHLFEIGEKQPGDKITVIDKTGNLYNVYWAADGKGILIQNVTLKAVMGKTMRYESWNDAQIALDQTGGWELYGRVIKYATGTVVAFLETLLSSITKRIAEVDIPWKLPKKYGNG